jgi:hypothetical protein
VSFFSIEPEASGSLAACVPGKSEVYVLDGWLGDDLVRAHPGVLVTTPVKNALFRLRQPTGFRVTRARIRMSDFFRKHNPGRKLPPFCALAVHGEPGRDDMGLTTVGTLVVSRRVLDVLLDFRIGRSVLAQYTVEGRAGGRQEAGASRENAKRPRAHGRFWLRLRSWGRG